ncbi:hypothetical protein JCM10908_006792 [Rhodotorula pacifica]|uniref:alpha-1,2-mannosidase MNL1 n=1 Tax=Rhodotorula pacifica TaxID=1495444 RepID=UPI00317BC964
MHGLTSRTASAPCTRRCFRFLLALAAVVSLVVCPATVDAAFYSSQRKAELRSLAHETWNHAYNSYKRVAFPADELLPLSCSAQGHDRQNPDNAGVNDVMGDYLLTVVDSLDTFPMLDDKAGFEQAVREVLEHVSFDVDSRVQVFEVTIRMMGGLLSGHLLATPPESGNFTSSIRGYSLPWYNGELLALAHDLGRRLLPAFDTPTGIPFARVHLQKGLRGGKGGRGESAETCSAGAGSLLLEFITLSRLTGDSTFEDLARRAFFAIWNRKSDIGLIGNTIDVRTGLWMHGVAGIGAGIDSFYEYAAKAYVLTGEDDYLRVWEEGYAALQRYVRSQDGFWFRGVNMVSGQLTATVVDSLSAFMPGVLTLMGDLDTATKLHAPFAFMWARYSGLPELFDTHRRNGANFGYPLRPEFIESNMYLYQATRDDWYLEVAERALKDINERMRTECGFAAVLDLRTGKLEDKMPSFVTAETLKYLYLTFAEDSPFLRDDSAFVFSTEGHPLEIPRRPSSPPPPSRRSKSLRNATESIPIDAPDAVLTGLARSCPAHEPVYDERFAHFLSLGMDRRNDWEHARWLAGHESPDEPYEIATGRWNTHGWCQIAEAESFGIELLFAAAGSQEIISPEPSQVSPHPSGNGDIVVNIINGLRFILTPLPYGADGYFISRIGPVNVPAGAYVVIRDQAVIASIPPVTPVEKIYLMANLSSPGDAESSASPPAEELYPTGLYMQALAASFGPSLAYRSPEAIPPAMIPFMIDGPPLPLTIPRFDPYGCEPYHSRPAGSAIEPHLVLLHRGHCSFALKSHHAALAGAKGVVLVSHPSPTDAIDAQNLGGFVVPGADAADEEEDTMRALVPLVLVANTTGQTLEDMVRRVESSQLDEPNTHATAPKQQVLRGNEPTEPPHPDNRVLVRLLPDRDDDLAAEEEGEEHVDGLVLGGYVVRNIKLHRIRAPSRQTP